MNIFLNILIHALFVGAFIVGYKFGKMMLALRKDRRHHGN